MPKRGDGSESVAEKPKGRHSGDAERFDDHDLFIVSIQSQKGGVGKSTAALALADLLSSDEKYNVLVIDADITGTNLALAVESSFWADRVHVVERLNKRQNAFDLGSHFIHEYLKGASLPSFAEEAKPLRLTCDPRCPNIVGSSFPFDETQDRGSTGAMFNEFFSPLFLEYVEGIAHSFHEVMRTCKGNRALNTAIIIDNSPGHVGLVAELEDWVTDLGPKRGKTLFVATPDGHDLRAVMRAATAVFSRLQTKWTISRAYVEMRQEGTSKKKEQKLDRKLLDGEAGQFFLALAEADAQAEALAKAKVEVEKEAVARTQPRRQHIALSPTPLKDYDFYLDRIIPAGRDNMVKEPRWSIGALVNLVPESLLEEINRAPAGTLGEILRELPAGQQPAENRTLRNDQLDVLGLSRPGSAQCFVPFDPSMRDQYMGKAYSVISRPRAGSLQRLDEVLTRLTRRTQPLGGEKDGLHYGNMRAITAAIDLANRGIDALALHGPAYARSLIRSSWLPSAIPPLLRELSQSLMPELELEITAQDFSELAARSEDVRNRADLLASWIRRDPQLGKPVRGFGSGAIHLIAETLALAVEGGRHKRVPFNDDRIRRTALTIAERQRAVAALWRFDDQAPSRSGRPGSRLLGVQFGQKLARHEAELPPLDDATRRSYLLCCESEARILDLREDTEFLFRILRSLAELKPGNSQGAMRVSSIARRVIQTKELTHESAQSRLTSVQLTERQLTAFEDALRSIIRDWGIP